MATFQGDTIVSTTNFTRDNEIGAISYTVTSGRFAVIEISHFRVATPTPNVLSVAGIDVTPTADATIAGLTATEFKQPMRYILTGGQTFSITNTGGTGYSVIVNIFEYNNP